MSIRDILAKIQAEPKLKESMETLQLTEKNFRFLPIFPMIYVAWSDGKLQPEEVEQILQAAEENGLTDGDGAGVLAVWLNPEKRPDDRFFLSGLRLVAGVLRYTKREYKGNLLQLCEAVAEAASLTGSVTSEEKLAMQSIANLLGLEEEGSYERLLLEMSNQLTPEELTWLPTQFELRWVLINGAVSVGIAALIFGLLWWWYPSFVVTSHHMGIFAILGFVLPPVGFFFGSLITARLSPGDTSQEGVLGTTAAIVLALFVGFFFLGMTSKKFVGYNVTEPDPIFYPQCEGLLFPKQRCIRVDKHEGKVIFRLMPNASMKLTDLSLGRKFQDWFPASSCKGKPAPRELFRAPTSQPKSPSNTPSPLLYEVQVRPFRYRSKGYYPLCSESKDPEATCIRMMVNLNGQLSCRLMPNAFTPLAKAKPKKQFDTWFPAPRYCHVVYTRIYALWSKQGTQSQFVGYLPDCQDMNVTNQECIYITTRKSAPEKQVCLVSDSPTTAIHEIEPHAKPYRNWYPSSSCQELHTTTPLWVMFAAVGFALVAFFASWLGGIAGERWQGTI